MPITEKFMSFVAVGMTVLIALMAIVAVIALPSSNRNLREAETWQEAFRPAAAVVAGNIGAALLVGQILGFIFSFPGDLLFSAVRSAVTAAARDQEALFDVLLIGNVALGILIAGPAYVLARISTRSSAPANHSNVGVMSEDQNESRSL